MAVSETFSEPCSSDHMPEKLWVDLEGIFSAEIASWRIDFFSRCDFELNLGLFVFEAALQDGSAPALIRQIRNADNLKDIPIVVFTATDDEEAKLACLAAGATKIFPKGAATARSSYFLRRCSATTAPAHCPVAKEGAEMLADYAATLGAERRS